MLCLSLCELQFPFCKWLTFNRQQKKFHSNKFVSVSFCCCRCFPSHESCGLCGCKGEGGVFPFYYSFNSIWMPLSEQFLITALWLWLERTLIVHIIWLATSSYCFRRNSSFTHGVWDSDTIQALRFNALSDKDCELWKKHQWTQIHVWINIFTDINMIVTDRVEELTRHLFLLFCLYSMYVIYS